MTIHRYRNGCKIYLKPFEFGTHIESEVTCEDCLKINNKKEIKMSENKYPLIKKFLPDIKIVTNTNFSDIISAERLEEYLRLQGQVRFGNDDFATSPYKCNNDTHTGLLIGYHKIKKENTEPVSKEEIIKVMRGQYGNLDHMLENLQKLCDRIEKNGVK